MPKRKPKKDASASAKKAKHAAPARVDVEIVSSRNTDLTVDYEEPCTMRRNQTCHLCDNTGAWNGFFAKVGLELQESHLGEMSLRAVRKSMKKSCRPTIQDKAQAATTLQWLLTAHKCVKAVSINEDIFRGQEDVVCGALSGSVGVLAVELQLCSSRRLLTASLISALISMKHLKRVDLVIDTQRAFFANVAPLVKSSSPMDVFRAILLNSRLDTGADGQIEILARHKALLPTSITTRIFPEFGCRSRADPGSATFTWSRSQSLTALSVTASCGGPELDVRAVCNAVPVSPVLTELELGLLKLKAEYAAPIGKMLGSANALKHFGLTYADVEMAYKESLPHKAIDSLIAQYHCLRCKSFHMLETARVTPWMEALFQTKRSLKELRFSFSAFCTLECRALLSALSKNTTLKMVTVPVLGQIPSEFFKSINMTGAMDRVSAEPVCDVVYPKKPPALRQKVGRLVRVPFEDLERTLSGAYECHLVTHVQMRVYSFLCLSGDTDPTTSPLVQLIHKAPALATVAITVDDYCCSECWNKIAPPLCDAILHNKGVHAFEVNLPKKADMQLLPLAELLQCNPSLYRFALKPPGPKAFRDFLRKAAKKKLWDNCNLAIVDLKYSGQDMQKEKLLLQNVVDRNCKLAMRAARFVGGARSMENAEALKKVFGSQFLVKKVCDALQENRQQALRRIATCLEEVTDGKPT